MRRKVCAAVAILALGVWLAPSVVQAAVAFRAGAQAGAPAAGTIVFRTFQQAAAPASSTIAFRAAAQAGAASGVLTLTINKPAGTVQNDVMVASIAFRAAVADMSTVVVTAPANWTLVRRMNNNTATVNSLAVYSKVAGASELGNYSWGFSTSTGSAGGILTFSGVDTTTPIDVENGQNTPSSLSHATPIVTTTVANTMLVTSHGIANADTWTPPAGMTERVDVLGGNEAIEINTVLQAAAASTGAKTATSTPGPADAGNAHILALRPGAASLTINKPTGTALNDVMVATIGISANTPVITAPAGWTLSVGQFNNTATNANSLAVYWLVAGASEPASYTWTFSAPTSSAGGILRFDGVDTVSPVNAEAGQTTASSLTHATPAITPTAANVMLVASFTFSSSATWTTGSGMTEAVDVLSQAAGANGQSTAVYYAAQGPTGSISETATASGNADVGNTHLLALRPATQPSLTIFKPTGTALNDVMVASIGFRPNTLAITPPSGWTLVRRIDNANSPANSLAVYRLVAGASEPASYTWTSSPSGILVGGILSFSGVDTTTPIDVENGQNTPLGLTHDAPSVTTTVANTMLVTSHTYASAGTWTPPTGMTEAVDVAAGSQSIEANYVLQAAVGATGVKTATAANDADIGNAHILALRPMSSCGAVADATYAAASATSTAATVYWSSANPVLILRKSGGSITDTPVGGTTYTAGTQPWGAGGSTVVYSGSVAATSFLDTVAGRTTTDRYKVFAKTASPCYAPGLQVDASVPSGTAWSYAMASLSGNSMLKPGIAGNGTIYPSSMSSRIISLSTADGTRSWDPISSTGAIQGWLTWLPVGGDVTSGLAGHWKLDDGSGPTAADSSGNGKTGTLRNSPTWTTGKIGGALSFNGVNQYVDGWNVTGGSSTGTVSAWVKFNSVTWGVNGTSVYHSGVNYPTGGDNLMLGSHPGLGTNLIFGVYTTSWNFADSGLVPSTGRWYHLVGTWGSQGLKIYIDGVLKGTNSSFTGSVPSTVTDQIGCNSYSDGCVNGLIDDVRTYNRALSDAEVSKLYLSGGGYYGYRQGITVTAGAAAVPNGYSVPVTVDHAGLVTAGKSQANGDDVRIRYWNGAYWVELDRVLDGGSSWNNASTTIWFKTQAAIGASASDANYYLYYGNPSAVSPPADPNNVYLFYDDFSWSDALANHGWTAQLATWSAAGGVMTGSGSAATSGVLSHSAATTDAVIEARARGMSDVCSDCRHSGVGLRLSAAGAGYVALPNDNSSARLTLDKFSAWGSFVAYLGTFNQTLTGDTWYRVKLQAIGTTLTAKAWQDGTGEPGWQVSTTDATYASGTEIALYSGWTSPKHSEFDWVKVRKAVNPEPGTALAAEEALSAGGGVIGGDQSGRVYSVDTTIGATNWGNTAALTGADAIQAGVSAQVRAWSNPAFQAAYTDDVIFAATWNAIATSNKVFALKASDGTSAGWTFNANGTDYSVDYIAGQPYVDYARNRIYVASRAGSGGGQQSLWVIKTVDGEGVLKGQPMAACAACTVANRHFETSPTLSYDGNTLYIGADNGTLYAINAGALTLKWTLAVGSKINTSGFVWEDYTTAGRLYFVTADGNVRCVQDNGASAAACTGWTVTNVPGAATPLLLNKLFVGANDGTVRQINLTNGTQDKQFPAAASLDGTPLGAISTETGNEIFVGTNGGKIFKINLTSGALP